MQKARDSLENLVGDGGVSKEVYPEIGRLRLQRWCCLWIIEMFVMVYELKKSLVPFPRVELG